MSNLITPQSSQNNYILHNKIGEGTYGEVYKATQISTGQIVAIKKLKHIYGCYDNIKNTQIAKIEHEIRLCTKINHPNIVKVLDRGITKDNEHFSVFEYVPGITLKDYILTRREMSIINITELMGQVLDALVCIHNAGIIHRDLKPKNIMIYKTGAKKHIKILDFGIGRANIKVATINQNKANYNNGISGSPAYCSPEQLKGEATTNKTDLYAWGLILLEWLTGKPAITGNTVNEILQNQLHSNSIAIPPYIADHPIGAILLKVLDKHSNSGNIESQTIFNDFNAIDFKSLELKIAAHTSLNLEEGDLTF